MATIHYRDTPIPAAEILRTEAARKAIGHLAVERGGKQARKYAWQLARILRRVAAQLPDGGHLAVRGIDWNTHLMAGLGCEVWYVISNRIQWEAAIYTPFGSQSRIEWRYGTDRDPVWRSASRADVLVRDIEREAERRRAKRQAQCEEQAAAYVASLPAEAQALQRTCRATCIRVAPDGRSVTEALHDVGGSMTFRGGSNGWRMPESLADMQAQHDAVYHPEAAR